jgi:hypothetical protein
VRPGVQSPQSKKEEVSLEIGRTELGRIERGADSMQKNGVWGEEARKWKQTWQVWADVQIHTTG